jgi:type III secretion protein V
MNQLKNLVSGDIGMVAVIVAILALMIFPVPTLVIDVFLAFNMTISVVLLMATMYIPSAVALTSFPSLLLFTTLLRLSLNIASTKNILLHADGGHIIDAFGNLVVGGNMVVGIVVFLVITVVQFIVITKGSERVAEVGARFTLDAMPGKQMSIDADLRAGHLSGDEARHKRSDLARESQLHGGMDGAMKFVKGDAVCSLIITAINIFAGIIVGVMFHGMTGGEAANRFAILSIGDAMVSSIPSLLIAVAAGVMITRVADDMRVDKQNLGQEIFAQLSASPRSLYISAVLLLGFAAVPGFPWYVFLALSAGLVMAARSLSKKQPGGGTGKTSKALQREGSTTAGHGIEDHASEMACPLALALSPQLAGALRQSRLNLAFEAERTALQGELGLPFPGIRVWKRADLEGFRYEVLVHDVPAAAGELMAGHLLVVDPPPELLAACTEGGPVGGQDVSHWIAVAQQQTQAKDVKCLAPEEILARHAVRVLRQQAHQFLGIQEVQWVLERVGREYPGLVAEVQKVLPAQRVAEVLRRLLEEQISIRNLRSIFESLIVWGPKEKDVLMLTEYVRGDLGRYLTHRATGGQGSLAVVLLDQQLEKAIREAIKPTPTGNFLALPPEHIAAIAQRIGEVAGPSRPGLAVVTSMDIRRYVQRALDAHLPWLRVYSFQELGSHARLEPVGKVTF